MNNLTPGLVSVGLPTYNRAAQLRTALDCITGQTYRNLEILVSDNCSDDQTAAIAQEYMRIDSRISYSRNASNVGPVANLMLVADKARGEFFMWASDDDEWAPVFVEKMVTSLLANPGTTLAFCQTEYFLGDHVFPHFSQGTRLALPPDATERERIERAFTGNFGELFYGIYRTEALMGRGGANFAEFDLINAPLKALSIGSGTVSPDFIYRKSVSKAVFLWTYVCARDAENRVVPEIEALLKRHGPPRWVNPVAAVETALWFAKYWRSSHAVLGRIGLAPENLQWARRRQFRYLFSRLLWTIGQRDYS